MMAGGNGTTTLTNCTISGNSASFSGGGMLEGIFGSGAVTLTNCTISGNSASQSGGGMANYSVALATLTDCTISGNSAGYGGGGLENQGTSTLIDCTISGNSAASGGGVYTGSGGVTTLTSVTISGNSATNGGGLYTGSGGVTALINVTISGNSASQNGGGLDNAGGTTWLYDCTVSGNSASGSGGGVYNASGTVTLGNTIVAGNTAATGGPDAFGIFTSLGHNLIGETDGSSGWVGSDLTGTVAHPLNPLLAPLAWYGGPTETMALIEGSLAIDAGSNALVPAGITTDQRGFARIVNGTVDIGAFESAVPSGPLVVNSTADGGSPPGTLDLRAAVDLADIRTGAQAITFDPTVFATDQTITLSFGPLELSNTTGLETITGPEAGVTVSGGGLTQVFVVASAVTAALSGLTITGGFTTGNGGGLYNEGGTTTLTGVTVSGNSASGRGGGVFNAKRGTTTIINCSISGNSAAAGRRRPVQRWGHNHAGQHHRQRKHHLRQRRRPVQRQARHDHDHQLLHQRQLRGRGRRTLQCRHGEPGCLHDRRQLRARGRWNC